MICCTSLRIELFFFGDCCSPDQFRSRWPWRRVYRWPAVEGGVPVRWTVGFIDRLAMLDGWDRIVQLDGFINHLVTSCNYGAPPFFVKWFAEVHCGHILAKYVLYQVGVMQYWHDKPGMKDPREELQHTFTDTHIPKCSETQLDQHAFCPHQSYVVNHMSTTNRRYQYLYHWILYKVPLAGLGAGLYPNALLLRWLGRYSAPFNNWLNHTGRSDPKTWNAEGKPSQNWLTTSGNQSWALLESHVFLVDVPLFPLFFMFFLQLPFLIDDFPPNHVENTRKHPSLEDVPLFSHPDASNFDGDFPSADTEVLWAPPRYADLRGRTEILLQHPTPMCLGGRSWPHGPDSWWNRQVPMVDWSDTN